MITEPTNRIMEAVRAAFAASDLSMNALCKRSGTNYSSVHRTFARGNNHADATTLDRWCRVLGLELRSVAKGKKG